MKNKVNLSITPVILCGGSGTRLWPLSRKSYPKQFLKLGGQESLFRQAVKRSINIKSKSRKINAPIIVTNEDHRFIVLEELEGLFVDAKIILEPNGKKTAPALTLASLLLQEENSVMIVLSADHLI